MFPRILESQRDGVIRFFRSYSDPSAASAAAADPRGPVPFDDATVVARLRAVLRRQLYDVFAIAQLSDSEWGKFVVDMLRVYHGAHPSVTVDYIGRCFKECIAVVLRDVDHPDSPPLAIALCVAITENRMKDPPTKEIEHRLAEINARYNTLYFPLLLSRESGAIPQLQKALFDAVDSELVNFEYWALSPANAALCALYKHHKEFNMLTFPAQAGAQVSPLYQNMPQNHRGSEHRIQVAARAFSEDESGYLRVPQRPVIPVHSRLTLAWSRLPLPLFPAYSAVDPPAQIRGVLIGAKDSIVEYAVQFAIELRVDDEDFSVRGMEKTWQHFLLSDTARVWLSKHRGAVGRRPAPAWQAYKEFPSVWDALEEDFATAFRDKLAPHLPFP